MDYRRTGPRFLAWPRAALPDLLFDGVERFLNWARIDFRPVHRPPAWRRVGLATVLAIVGSLLADAAIVAIGQHVFPATKGFAPYQFPDYAELTVLGVVILAAGSAPAMPARAEPGG